MVILKAGRWRCLWRILKRVVFGYGEVRKDMAPGCPEQFDCVLLVSVWKFPNDQRPKLKAALPGFDGRFVRLGPWGGVGEFLEGS